MISDVMIFRNDEFGRVRVVKLNDGLWFVGKDVAEILGYADTFGALKKHVDEDDKQNCQNDSFESPRGLIVISESGLYSLIFSSKLPSAKIFKRWVTHEVLPAIRKTGEYNYQSKIEQAVEKFGRAFCGIASDEAVNVARQLLDFTDNTAFCRVAPAIRALAANYLAGKVVMSVDEVLRRELGDDN